MQSQHIFFSGIGGAGIGPLALIALEAGYRVSGSDKQAGGYVETLKKRGINNIHIGQTKDAIARVHATQPIDWLVYSSAVAIENPHHPELVFAKENDITATKRDAFLSKLLKDHHLKLIAIAGTHGKTTTTAMCIWLFKQLGIPISYSVGAKLSFGGLGQFDPDSEYFIYEADEFDRNFLSFEPYLSVISGIDWDHPDIYPAREEYYNAFRQFIDQSQKTAIWGDDATRIGVTATVNRLVLATDNDLSPIRLSGVVNRKNAFIAASALAWCGLGDQKELIAAASSFPGLSRRFEKIAENIYSDYAHTPEKIKGALQLAHEVAGDNVVVVYEGLHNTRQHFIKDELAIMFKGVQKLYIVPSYLAREDKELELLTPEKLSRIIQHPPVRIASQLNNELKQHIDSEAKNGNLVLCLTAGGGGSLDEWLRNQYINSKNKV